MGVKTRIFIWVTSLFVLAWAVFFIVGYYEMQTNIQKAQLRIQDELRARNEARQEQISKFLVTKLAEIQAVSVINLTMITSYDWMLEKFLPTPANYDRDTWRNTAVLLYGADQEDLVQNINEGKLVSCVLAAPPFIIRMVKIPIGNDVNIIVRKFPNGRLDFSIGVRYDNKDAQVRLEMGMQELNFNLQDDVDFWLLFSLDALLNEEYGHLDEEILQKPISSSLRSIVLQIIKVHRALQTHPELVNRLSSPEFSSWMREQVGGAFDWKDTQKDPCIATVCLPEGIDISESLYQSLLDLNARWEGKHLIYELASLINNTYWNYDPNSPLSPIGLGRFPNIEQDVVQNGYGIMSEDVFLKKPFVCSSSCQVNPQQKKGVCLDSTLQVIQSGTVGAPIFLGLTMNMADDSSGKRRYGNLTLGMNADNILQDIAMSTQENLFFVSGNAVLKAYGSDGHIISTDLWKKVDLKKLITQKEGEVSDIDGNEYFFTHLVPLDNDMHFFVFRLKEDDLRLSGELRVETMALIHKIAIQLGVIACIFLLATIVILDQVLRKLMRPITELSVATDEICHGELNKVNLPAQDGEGNDEISTLYRSFRHMVDHMLEGEKAKGLLNKAVSKKIAHKIMNAGVHLGGEKRDVTILFSDIRNFTVLSEQMDPEDLLALLNLYLTRMSNIVDFYEGVIDKYVGDEIMALFGAPLDAEDPSGQAILCAIDMVEDIKKWNEERKAQGLRILEIGTGINTGTVVAGNIGSGERSNYTVIGQVVNVAQRLCSAAKEMEIIVCKSTLDRMVKKEDILYEECPPLELKGVSYAVSNYRIFGRARSSS